MRTDLFRLSDKTILENAKEVAPETELFPNDLRFGREDKSDFWNPKIQRKIWLHKVFRDDYRIHKVYMRFGNGNGLG